MSESIHTSQSAKKRLQKRYKKERVFKFYGLLAILISLGFLFTLLFTITIKAIPAFSYHFISLPYDFSELDKDNINSLEKANYDRIIRDAIRAQFPMLNSRKEKKILSSLISSGAPVILREQVLKKPQNIDNPLKFEVPISDFADLYLKGQISKDRWIEKNSQITLTINKRKAELIANEQDFAFIFAIKNKRLENELKKLQEKHQTLDNLRQNLSKELTQTTQNPASENLNKQLAKTNSQIDKIKKQITKIEQQKSSNNIAKLTRNDASILLYLADSVIKLERIENNIAKGEILLPFSQNISEPIKNWRIRIIEKPQANRKFSDLEMVLSDKLIEYSLIAKKPNWIFATRGASREPEMAGIWGAVVGSFLTITITLLFAFPLGVAAAIYLEEFAPKNRLTAIIEVNINNLAAVPSIVFGLLGLAVFLNFFGLGRSTPLVGGMVLGLMTLPIIIIASRVALNSVPPSIREAALGIGASKLQTVMHHVLPLATPGIMTGTIIGLARALGETAPLLMIGMVAFVVDIPKSFNDPATIMPVQIYMWADFPEPAFEQKTSAAIIVLLVFLILMNALAVILRKKFERRW